MTPSDLLQRVAWLHTRDLERERTWGQRGIEPWATFHANHDERIILADRRWLDAHGAELLRE